MSRAVELMVAHVENLRRRYDRNAAELEEAKRVIQQQNSYRNIIDSRASPGLTDAVGRAAWFDLLSSEYLTDHSLFCSFFADPDDSDSRMKSYQQV